MNKHFLRGGERVEGTLDSLFTLATTLAAKPLKIFPNVRDLGGARGPQSQIIINIILMYIYWDH